MLLAKLKRDRIRDNNTAIVEPDKLGSHSPACNIVTPRQGRIAVWVLVSKGVVPLRRCGRFAQSWILEWIDVIRERIMSACMGSGIRNLPVSCNAMFLGGHHILISKNNECRFRMAFVQDDQRIQMMLVSQVIILSQHMMYLPVDRECAFKHWWDSLRSVSLMMNCYSCPPKLRLAIRSGPNTCSIFPHPLLGCPRMYDFPPVRPN